MSKEDFKSYYIYILFFALLLILSGGFFYYTAEQRKTQFDTIAQDFKFAHTAEPRWGAVGLILDLSKLWRICESIDSFPPSEKEVGDFEIQYEILIARISALSGSTSNYKKQFDLNIPRLKNDKDEINNKVMNIESLWVQFKRNPNNTNKNTLLTKISDLMFLSQTYAQKFNFVANRIVAQNLRDLLIYAEQTRIIFLIFFITSFIISMLAIYLFLISKKRQDELVFSKEEAEKANKAKSSFLATMSHEIRTPMNGIIGMAEVLRESPLNSDQERILDTIRNSGFSLLKIINDILDFSKIEADHLVLETLPISIESIVEGVSESVALTAAQKGLVLYTYCDPDIPREVYGDQLRLRQILTNLLGNAVKFTEKGQVSIAADVLENKNGAVTLRYSVYDQGIGMTPPQVAQLFKPFQQAETSTTRRFGGTGLGTSIVRRLLDLMGGDISVESELGKGSRFEITLTHEIADEKTLNGQESLSGVKVLALIPEDETRIKSLTRYPESEGAHVDFGHEPKRVLEMAKAESRTQSPYDVVYIGLGCPDQDRLELYEALRMGNDFKGTRILWAQPSFGAKTKDHPEEVTLVPTAPLTRQGLLNGIASAIGRSITQAHVSTEVSIEIRREVPSVEDALAQNELILIVEDNKTNQDVITRQLNRLGYCCEVVDNGLQGLKAIRSGRYALVLSDVHMPEMDGFQMTDLVRQDEAGTAKRLPIVAVTANALAGDAERCIEAGMDDFLSKPVEMEKLKRLLARWLPHMNYPASESSVVKDTPVPSNTVESRDDQSEPLDTSLLLEMFGDDPEIIQEILQEFIAPAWETIEEMEKAYQAKQANRVGAAGHKLKSSAKTIGAHALSEASLLLEKAGKGEDWSAIENELPKIRSLMEEVELKIREGNVKPSIEI